MYHTRNAYDAPDEMITSVLIHIHYIHIHYIHIHIHIHIHHIHIHIDYTHIHYSHHGWWWVANVFIQFKNTRTQFCDLMTVNIINLNLLKSHFLSVKYFISTLTLWMLQLHEWECEILFAFSNFQIFKYKF